MAVTTQYFCGGKLKFTRRIVNKMFEKKTGKLKIFFSYADGVGKTLALLQEGAT